MSEPPAILALHGNLGSTRDWESLALPRLRAVDLWANVRLDFHEFARALAGPVSEGLDRPLLAGYSLGGRLALHALALFPDRWSGAVILSAHPGLGCVEDRLARSSSDAIWARRARDLPWEEFLSQWNSQPLFSGDTPEGQRALEPRREAVALAFETWSLGRQEDLRRGLSVFHGPVLWITGETDERFTRIGAEMGDVFADFRQVVVPGCGHRLLEDGAVELVCAMGETFGIARPHGREADHRSPD